MRSIVIVGIAICQFASVAIAAQPAEFVRGLGRGEERGEGVGVGRFRCFADGLAGDAGGRGRLGEVAVGRGASCQLALPRNKQAGMNYLELANPIRRSLTSSYLT